MKRAGKCGRGMRLQDYEGKDPEKSGKGKYIALGCLFASVLLIVGGFFAYRGIMKVVTDLAEEYTDLQPRTLPQVQVSESVAEATVARVDEFEEAVEEGNATQPFYLTSEEINQLIYHHPRWKALAGRVYVTIENDRVKGEVSIPLDEISIPLGEVGEFLKDRYLNGSAVFNIILTGGRLLIFVDSVEVKGKPLPEELMQHLRSENLAKEVENDEELRAFIEKLESITVEDGRLRIVPKESL